MKSRKFNSYHSFGFTLVELIVVIVIVSALAAGSALLLAQGFQAYTVAQNTINLQTLGRTALEIMGRDLRAIRSPADIITATPNSINFIDVINRNIFYQVSNGQLQRQIGTSGSFQTLVNNVQNITMSYYDATGTATTQNTSIRYIVIDLTIKINNISFTLSEGVYPWNLN